MKQTIQEIDEAIDRLKKELKILEESKEILQSRCGHEWEHLGWTHHHQLIACKHCGKRERN